MDSQDSSAAAPPNHHHHHPHPNPHHHHPQPPPPSVLINPHNHHHHQHHQQQQHPLPNNSYQLNNNNNNNNNNNSVNISNANIMHQQNPRFPFNPMAAAAAAKPMDHHFSDVQSSAAAGDAGFGAEPARKKRGRPRKYSPDNSIALGLSPATPGAGQMLSMVAHNDSGGGGGGTPSSDTPGKRNRGRPPGSGKKQMDALGLPGVGFTPHVITVNTGEDIASKIMAFSQQGPRTVCILSANGAICNVTLRQPAMSGGTVTYEGRFEIISLSGSFQLSESNGNRGRIGGLSVSLAGSDGRVLGGGVAGSLKAATQVQIVVGSFIADGKKSKSSSGPSSTPPSNMLNFGTPTAGVSPSPGASSESAEDNDDSPINRGSGHYANPGQQPIQSMPMYSNMGWPNSVKMMPN